MGAGAAVRSATRADDRRRLDAYVPPVLFRQLADGRPAPVQTQDATVLFADITGFTKLSERLARRGREGAEELTQAIDTTFGALLDVADSNGGDLLKHGGDALLLLFEGEGHVARACDSAFGMRRALREVGRLRTSAGPATLRMSQGIHSGEFHLFLVGESHRELLLTGPGATAVVAMEKAAGAGDDPAQSRHGGAPARAVAGRRQGTGHPAGLGAGGRRRARPGDRRRRGDRRGRRLPVHGGARARRGRRSAARAPQRDRRVPALRGHRRAHRAGGARRAPPPASTS